MFQEREAALGELDRHTAQKLALKREVERVQERMTLKHKNTSRWVKHALTQSKNNKGLQQAISEQLARQLRQNGAPRRCPSGAAAPARGGPFGRPGTGTHLRERPGHWAPLPLPRVPTPATSKSR